MFRSATHDTDKTQRFIISRGKAKAACLQLDLLVRRTPQKNHEKINTISTNKLRYLPSQQSAFTATHFHKFLLFFLTPLFIPSV
jgi:hypothetical protein